jgi:2-dehydro-3-deoxy-D-pentonate aldolase
MFTQTKFHGVIPPIPSILYEDGTIDEKGMCSLIDFLIDSKVHGLFFNGSGGEFSQMTIEVRKKVAELGVRHVNGRVPVLIGTGSPSTLETISLSLHAKEVGADGVVIINPYYWNLTEEGLYQHYSEIAENVDLPIMLYDFPGLTGQSLKPELVHKLAVKFPHIVGIKQSVKEVGEIRDLILQVKKDRPDFAVFSGFDDHLLYTLATGGDGSIPLTASFAPELSVGIYEAYQSNEYEKVFELHQKLAPLLQLYQLDTPFVNVAKEAIKLRGIEISTEVLPPLRSLSNEKRETMAELLSEYLPDIFNVHNNV